MIRLSTAYCLPPAYYNCERPKYASSVDRTCATATRSCHSSSLALLGVAEVVGEGGAELGGDGGIDDADVDSRR